MVIPETANSTNNYVGQEFGRAGRDILNKYGGFGENPDKVISTRGMSYVKDIERDPHLASALATRRAKLVKRGWRIVPASQQLRDVSIAEFVERQLIDMEGAFEKDLEGMLDSVGKGFSLTEINYSWVNWRGKSLVGLKSLRFKDPEWFSFKFDTLGYYTINQIDPNPNGVELPSDKFIHIITGPDDENPYGRSVTAEVAFWVWCKKNVAKFWAIFAEKFGMPLTMVEVPRNASEGDLAKIDEILAAIQEETGIRVPEGFTVKFLEAMRSGEANYERFIEVCNKEISKRVFGATLISEEGKRGQGSYALGNEHSGIFEDYVAFDAAILEAALSEQLIKRLVAFNWPLVEVYPRFEFIDFDMAVFITFSQALGNLVNAGLKIPVAWVHEKLRIPFPGDDESVLTPVSTSTPPGTAQVDQDGQEEGEPAKPDNRVKMGEGEWVGRVGRGGRVWSELEPGELGDLDRLRERYLAIVGERYEAAAAELKKKALRV